MIVFSQSKICRDCKLNTCTVNSLQRIRYIKGGCCNSNQFSMFELRGTMTGKNYITRGWSFIHYCIYVCIVEYIVAMPNITHIFQQITEFTIPQTTIPRHRKNDILYMKILHLNRVIIDQNCPYYECQNTGLEISFRGISWKHTSSLSIAYS